MAFEQREWTFGCFTLVPVARAGSPRGLPWLAEALSALLEVGQRGGLEPVRWWLASIERQHRLPVHPVVDEGARTLMSSG